MDRRSQKLSWWIIVLISVSTLLADSHLVHGRGSGAAGARSPPGARGAARPGEPAVGRQRSSGLGGRPRPVVAVRCHPDSMEVAVQADMFDTGLRVDGAYLRLGSGSAAGAGACRAAPSGAEEFTVRAQLTDCGTKLSSTKEKIIYSNVLVYAPEASSDGLLRLDGATIPVECHYEKKYAVESVSLSPTWDPNVSRTSAENQIDFHLQLMTDDWQFERGSYSYFLGDPIHFEVSYAMGNHVPLRVYVDHCVATATPDAEATLRYDFIEHHGCFTDAYLTNSSSHFLPRTMEHKLSVKLEAFRFYQEPMNQVYITCYLKAVPVTLTATSQNRACSLIENRWRSVDGNDQACRSCDISHQFEGTPTTEPPTTTSSTKAWSPMTSQESFIYNRIEHPARYIRFRPGIQQSQYNKPQHPSAKLMKRGTDNKAEKTMQLGPLIVLPSSKFVAMSTDAKVVLSEKNKTT